MTLTIRRLVYIAFFLETGLLLVVLPWSSFWSRNYFVMRWPAITPWVVNDFVRGGVTGLGVLNLIIAFWEMAHFNQSVKMLQGDEKQVNSEK